MLVASLAPHIIFNCYIYQLVLHLEPILLPNIVQVPPRLHQYHLGERIRITLLQYQICLHIIRLTTLNLHSILLIVPSLPNHSHLFRNTRHTTLLCIDRLLPALKMGQANFPLYLHANYPLLSLLSPSYLPHAISQHVIGQTARYLHQSFQTCLTPLGSLQLLQNFLRTSPPL